MSDSENDNGSKKLTLHRFKSFGVDDGNRPQDDGQRVAIRHRFKDNNTLHDNSRYAMVRTEGNNSPQLMIADEIVRSKYQVAPKGYFENAYEVIGTIDNYSTDILGYAAVNNSLKEPALTDEEAILQAEKWFHDPEAISESKKARYEERKQNLLKKIRSSIIPS